MQARIRPRPHLSDALHRRQPTRKPALRDTEIHGKAPCLPDVRPQGSLQAFSVGFSVGRSPFPCPLGAAAMQRIARAGEWRWPCLHGPVQFPARRPPTAARRDSGFRGRAKRTRKFSASLRLCFSALKIPHGSMNGPLAVKSCGVRAEAGWDLRRGGRVRPLCCRESRRCSRCRRGSAPSGSEFCRRGSRSAPRRR